MDAIDQLIDPANPLKLSWKSGAKKSIVIFSDEEPQSYHTTESYNTIKAKIANAPGKPLANVIVFTNSPMLIIDQEWSAALGSSNVYNINNLAAVISNDLETVIQRNSCN